MSVKYAIVENEYFALEHLKSIMSQLRPEYELVLTSESVEETVSYFKKGPDVDLILMDIELVDGNSFEIFSQVEITIPIIFITAYNQFAIQAFKVNSIDYILKPVSEISVIAAVEKFEKLNASKTYKLNYKKLTDFFEKKTKNRLLISKGDNYTFIYTNDIACFTSEDKYIFLITFSGSKHLTEYNNLSQAEEVLDIVHFFRLSRNLIVNIKSIVNVGKYFNGRLLVRLQDVCTNQNDIVVSAARRDSFLSWLDGNYNY